jgi:HD-GYP domain-containing protein (c-di-GMP phosphodiesterase class II)
LKDKDIPLAARVFAVVDVWDALSTDRPYRPAWPQDKIKAYLRNEAGARFDPQVVRVFLEKFLSQTENAA